MDVKPDNMMFDYHDQNQLYGFDHFKPYVIDLGGCVRVKLDLVKALTGCQPYYPPELVTLKDNIGNFFFFFLARKDKPNLHIYFFQINF